MESPKPAPPPLPKRNPPPLPDKTERKAPKRNSRNKHAWEELILIAVGSLIIFGGAAARLGEQAGWGFAILILLFGACAIFLFDRFKIQDRFGSVWLLILLLPFVAVGAVFRWFKRLFFEERTKSAPNIGDDRS